MIFSRFRWFSWKCNIFAFSIIFNEIFKNEKCNIFCAFNDFHRNLQISKNTIFLYFQRFSSKSSKIEKYNILCFRIFSSKSWYGYFSIKPEFSKIMVWIHGMDFSHNYGCVERPDYSTCLICAGAPIL